MTHPSVQKALTYMESGIHSGIWQQGERLPSIKKIGLLVNISNDNVRKAARELEIRGIIQIVRGSGCYVGKKKVSDTRFCSQKKWQIIRTRIERDLISEVLPGNRLPCLSALQSLYGVTYPTIKKAVESLLCDKTIFPDRNGFVVHQSRTNRVYSSILVISPVRKAPPEMTIERMKEFVSHLHVICRDYDIIPHCITDEFAETNWSSKYFSSIGTIIGVLIWSNDISSLRLERILKKCALLKVPVSIIDEIGDHGIMHLCQRIDRCKIFSFAGSVAGKNVGRYLLSRGHRKIAYISEEHNHTATWSAQRFNGLSQVFTSAGHDTCIQDVVLKTWKRESNPLLPQISSSGSELIVQFGIENIKEQLNNRLQQGLLPTLDLLAEIKSLSNSRELVTHKPNFDRAYQQIDDILFFESLMVLSIPVFKQLLADPALSAWVTNNDSIAAIARAFLKENRIKMPADISLVSFNDTLSAYDLSLTSYNFGISGIVRLAVSYIVNPQYRTFATDSVIEHEGILIERSSSGYRKE